MTAWVTEILKDVARIEPFPRAAIRVFELVLNDADSSEVTAVLEQDPGLTTKILSVANSAKFAPSVPILSVADATTRLGTRTLANLAMTTGCSSFFMGYGRSTQRSNTTLWQECLHVALFARHVAERSGYPNKDLAYTVGLLQNIGHIVLDRFMEEQRDEIKALSEDGVDLLTAEKTVLGMDHAQCSYRMARKWGFPSILTRAIRAHHSPADAADLTALCGIVNVAEGLAFESLSDQGTSMLYPVDRETATICKLDTIETADLAPIVRQEIMDTCLAG
ncbi:MAG: HD-like signal output (HDOD) protein [Chlamydiales bacterium]|jgi:HD-like signal output (HDOD) protein